MSGRQKKMKGGRQREDREGQEGCRGTEDRLGAKKGVGQVIGGNNKQIPGGLGVLTSKRVKTVHRGAVRTTMLSPPIRGKSQ
jgi:hypothetical protein